MIRGVHLDVTDSKAIRQLLAMVGIVGPWGAPDGEDVLSIVEANGLTWCCRNSGGLPHGAADGDFGDQIELPATVVMSRAFGFEHSALMPLYEGSCRDLPPQKFPGSERLLIIRESGHTIARAGKSDGRPYLVLGMSLSEFVRRVIHDHQFFGFSHLVTCFRWWLDHAFDRPILRMDPWPSGRRPCLISFDVEGMVARRSVGRSLLRFPPSRRPLLELNRLDMVRPLRGSRLTWSRNELIDPDGRFSSRRVVFDFRRGKQGCATKPLEVPQWQLHLLVPRRPAPQPTIDVAFHAWIDQRIPQATLYYCGGVPKAMRSRSEIGFHSRTHEHFHHMSTTQLDCELAEGRHQLGSDRAYRAVRAPGLLWNSTYFACLQRASYRIDSSFREVNAFQPNFPIRTASDWWELPVTGNVMTLPDLEGVLQSASRSGGMVNLHCHDHEAKESETRLRICERVMQIEAAGFTLFGHIEFVNWLEQSRHNEITSIRSAGDGLYTVDFRAVENTALHVPDGYLCTDSLIDRPISSDRLCSQLLLNGRVTNLTLRDTSSTTNVTGI